MEEQPTTTTILLPPTSTTGASYEEELKSTNKLPSQRVLFLHSDTEGGLALSSYLREQGFQVQDENVTLYDLSTENCDRVINEKAEHMNIFRPEIMIGHDKGANVAVEMIRRGCFLGPTVLLSLRVEELTNLELPSTVSVVMVHGTQDNEVPIALAQQMVKQNDPLVGSSFAFVQVDDNHSLLNITSSHEGAQASILTYIDTACEMKDRMAAELLEKDATPTMPRPAPESVIAPPPPTSTHHPGETSPEVTPNIVAADVAGVTAPGTVITSVEHLPIAGETVTAVVLPHDATKTESTPSAGTTTTTTTEAGETAAQTSKSASPQTSPATGRKETPPKSPGKEGNLHKLANAARKTKCTIQ